MSGGGLDQHSWRRAIGWFWVRRGAWCGSVKGWPWLRSTAFIRHTETRSHTHNAQKGTAGLGKPAFGLAGKTNDAGCRELSRAAEAPCNWAMGGRQQRVWEVADVGKGKDALTLGRAAEGYYEKVRGDRAGGEGRRDEEAAAARGGRGRAKAKRLNWLAKGIGAYAMGADCTDPGGHTLWQTVCADAHTLARNCAAAQRRLQQRRRRAPVQRLEWLEWLARVPGGAWRPNCAWVGASGQGTGEQWAWAARRTCTLLHLRPPSRPSRPHQWPPLVARGLASAPVPPFRACCSWRRPGRAGGALLVGCVRASRCCCPFLRCLTSEPHVHRQAGGCLPARQPFCACKGVQHTTARECTGDAFHHSCS